MGGKRGKINSSFCLFSNFKYPILAHMNPIYLAYLQAHNLTSEPKLYRFIVWAHGQAEAYRKAFNLPVIVDHANYSAWVTNLVTIKQAA